MNTYDEMQELVKNKKAVCKVKDNLTLYKYHRNVMFNYEWFNDTKLMECRGHVYDNITKKLVQCPVRKSFNYLENGWWSDVDLNSLVLMEKKYNGYMVAATLHENKAVITTTGSFSGQYQEYAEKYVDVSFLSEYVTHVFEMIADFDPHIVNEGSERIIPLGMRIKHSGIFAPFHTENRRICTLKEAISVAKHDRGEGFMLYKYNDEKEIDTTNCCKLKSDYYVGKKKLMRMNNKLIDNMYDHGIDRDLPDIFSGASKLIMTSFDREEWKNKTDQERRKFLEIYYE